SLTISINYEPVTAENQTNNDAGKEIHNNAGKFRQEKVFDHEYILFPFMPSNSLLDADEVPNQGDEGVSKRSGIDDQEKTNGSTQDVNTAASSINTANTNINSGSLNINNASPNDPSMPSLEETVIFDYVYDDREVGAEADTNNLELSIVLHQQAEKNKSQQEPKKVLQALADPSWIEAMQEELLQFKLQKV
nr:hypothetical protein [Tanacetum cinerariifolium]